jgi:MFS family permease
LLCVIRVVPAQTSVSAGTFKGFDWVGGTLYAPGVMLVLLAISQAPVSGWTSPLILLSIALGLGILAGWVVWEMRHRAPLIDIRLMLTRKSAFALLAYALLGIGPFQFGLTVYALLSEPAWAGAGFGLTATMAGVLNLPSAFMGCFSGPLSGLIAKAGGGRKVLLISTATYAAGWMGIVFSHDLLAVTLSIMVIGTAAPMGYTAIAAVLVEATPEERTSEVLGIAEVVRAIAMAVGSQVMAVILASSTVSRVGEGVFPSADAHHLTFYLTVATCVGAFVLALLIPRRTAPLRV